MKKILLTLFVVVAATTVSAQNPGAYFMENSAHRLQLNPAFAPDRGYFNIPAAGAVHVGLTGNMTIGNILHPYNGELVLLLNEHVSASRALRGLRDRNSFGLDTRVGIFSFGAFADDYRSFWSFDLNVRVEAGVNIPKNLIEFAKRGGEHVLARDIGASVKSYVEAAFSYSFPITDKIYLGARGKFIVGAARERVAIDRLDITATEDLWVIDGRGSFESSGLKLKSRMRDDGTEYYDLGDLEAKQKIPAGYGFGIDVGATWDVLDDLQVSLAVNDLGFIAWGKNQTSIGRMSKYISYKGVEIVDGEATTPDFDLGNIEFEKQSAKGVTESLHTSIVAGGEYKLWQRKIGLGLLYNVKFWDERAYHNITASATLTPVDWFTFGTSYSFLANRGHSLGLAVNFSPRWINFFLATDILIGEHTTGYFLPVNSSSMNVTVGLGIPIGKYNHRRAKETRTFIH